jgi:NAD(P)H-flavin reductase
VSNHSVDCIDVGSENCPCYLALTNDCLICSRLQGREGCDCNWKGVCVYNEFIQGNRRVNNPRTDFATEIVYRKNYLDDLIVLGLRVGKGFAIKASRPGSYVFLREKNSESYYATPLCVMEANIEDGIIAVAIKIISAKTKTLAKAEGSLMIRGIYRNGVLGIDSITSKHVKDKKILVVAKGIGLAPAILTVNYLWSKNRVDLIIDMEKISEDLIADYLGEGEGTIRFMQLNEEGYREDMGDILEKEQYDIVVLLTSDYFLEQIGNMVRKRLPRAELAVSNNFRICCGEGICGACTVAGKDGDWIKMCKCNTNHISHAPSYIK